MKEKPQLPPDPTWAAGPSMPEAVIFPQNCFKCPMCLQIQITQSNTDFVINCSRCGNIIHVIPKEEPNE